MSVWYRDLEQFVVCTQYKFFSPYAARLDANLEVTNRKAAEWGLGHRPRPQLSILRVLAGVAPGAGRWSLHSRSRGHRSMAPGALAQRRGKHACSEQVAAPRAGEGAGPGQRQGPAGRVAHRSRLVACSRRLDCIRRSWRESCLEASIRALDELLPPSSCSV